MNERLKTKIAACRAIYVARRGREHPLIEREMRANGYPRFSRRCLYARGKTVGWIDRFGWDAEIDARASARRSRKVSHRRGPVRGRRSPAYTNRRSLPKTSAGGLRTQHSRPPRPKFNRAKYRRMFKRRRRPAPPPPPTPPPPTPPVGPCLQDFPAWLRRVSPEMTWDQPHQEYIFKKLQQVTEGSRRRVMIFMPPRHGKSEMVTVRYTAWRLLRDPSLNVILASYNQQLANRFSRKVKKVICDHTVQLLNEQSNSQLDEPTQAGTAKPGTAGTDAASAFARTSHDPNVHRIDTPDTGGTGVAGEGACVPGQEARGGADYCDRQDVCNAKNFGCKFTAGAEPASAGTMTSPNPKNPKSEIRNPKFPVSPFPFTRQRLINTVAEWETSLGGGLRAVGVGGGATGFGAGFIALDDPVKSRAEAESAVFRDKLWDWFNNDIYTRLEPNGSIILTLTRWHEDDLAGRLLRNMENGGEQWEVIQLPALAEAANDEFRISNIESENKTHSSFLDSSFEIRNSTFSQDALGRQPGEPLWPTRFSLENIERIRRQMGSYEFSALYQQRPIPADGGIFKREWLKTVVDRPPPGMRWFRGYDLAVSKSTKADYCASFRVAFAPDGTMYIADGWRKRAEYPEQRRFVIRCIENDRNTVHGIEDALHGRAFVQELKTEARVRGHSVRNVKAESDKLTRALAWSPLAEAGKLVLVRGPWIDEFIAEACAFPSGAHDDQIDAVSIAVILGRGPKRTGHAFD